MDGDIYNPYGTQIGRVDFLSGKVTDGFDRNVASVMTYGSGTIENAEGWRRGEVSMSGTVSDLEGWTVGTASRSTVYDRDSNIVGTVDARTRTNWITGITDAHKAAGALLLLILRKGN